MSSTILRTIILALIACGISGAVLFKLQSPRVRTVIPTADGPITAAPASHARNLKLIESDIARTMSNMPVNMPPAPRSAVTRAVSSPSQPATDPSEDLDPNDPALRLPLARMALATVGTDEFAEQLWLHAINDLEIAADARKDLIEDLNQDGFADPKHLSPADLPLIESRLALIERLAPEAMDKTNADAFAEAKKDLIGMREQLLKAAPVATPAPVPSPQ